MGLCYLLADSAAAAATTELPSQLPTTVIGLVALVVSGVLLMHLRSGKENLDERNEMREGFAKAQDRFFTELEVARKENREVLGKLFEENEKDRVMHREAMRDLGLDQKEVANKLHELRMTLTGIKVEAKKD